MSTHPSVLVLIADDWSPLAGCYGNAVVRTPNIDSVAAKGMLFERAYCTTPSCAASRANILTGLYSHQHGQYGHTHGVHHFSTHEHVRSLPAILNDAGVLTGMIGKDHVSPQSVYPFSHYDKSLPWRTRDLVASTRRFLKDADGKSFYLQVGSMYPHRTGGDFDPSVGDGYEPDVRYSPDEVIVPDFLPDTIGVRHELADYYRFVTRFDRFVGEVLGELERAGRIRDTLVMILSDHGMPFPGAKASSYNTGHHCPLIIRHPDGYGGKTDAGVNWTDIAPTVTDFLDVSPEECPEEWTGRSLLPLLAHPAAPGYELTWFSHSFHEVTNYYPYRAVLDRRYKYVRHLAYREPMPLGTDLYDSVTWQQVLADNSERMGSRVTRDVCFRPQEALYDLDDDPMETVNLIDESGLRETAERLRAALMQMRLRTRDPWLELDYQQGRLPEHLRDGLSGRSWHVPRGLAPLAQEECARQ